MWTISGHIVNFKCTFIFSLITLYVRMLGHHNFSELSWNRKYKINFRILWNFDISESHKCTFRVRNPDSNSRLFQNSEHSWNETRDERIFVFYCSEGELSDTESVIVHLGYNRLWAGQNVENSFIHGRVNDIWHTDWKVLICWEKEDSWLTWNCIFRSL